VIELLVSGVLAFLVYVGVTVFYFEIKTRGDRYFAMPLAQRQHFIKRLQNHARIIRPLFEAVAKFYRPKVLPLTRYRGVSCPRMMSPKKACVATMNYQPGEEDIFVATQMKCGTTWMQQIIFQILCHGEGDLSDQGYRHMYALSPWIETDPRAAVPLARAPLVGETRKRIIKTHMPEQLCPHSEKAKYIYVTRHPVSCFSSCFDFVQLLGGPIAPSRENLLSWYCSDRMWWSSWPDHVEGWWRRSEKHGNVLFIHYEAMKIDLAGEVARVAEFVECNLNEEEIGKVVEKSSFAYMKEHETHFEMHAPNIFSVSAKQGGFIKAGTIDRYKDVSEDEAEMIMEFCRKRLAGANYPLDRYYPGVNTAQFGKLST
jgi:hypothetical protein